MVHSVSFESGRFLLCFSPLSPSPLDVQHWHGVCYIEIGGWNTPRSSRNRSKEGAIMNCAHCPAAGGVFPDLYRFPGCYEPFSALSHLLGAIAFLILGWRLLRCA